MMRVKKKDKVEVISGKDSGKKGEIIEILPKKDKVKVKGVAIATHHKKARKAGDKAGIVKKESFIHISKVMPICSFCKKSTRVGFKVMEDGKKARSCKRCNEIF